LITGETMTRETNWADNQADQASHEDGGELIRRLTIALADACRRPMGVVPDSAAGLVTQAELDAAELRRPRVGAQVESIAVNPTPREK
jgi:hypothetical protein